MVSFSAHQMALNYCKLNFYGFNWYFRMYRQLHAQPGENAQEAEVSNQLNTDCPHMTALHELHLPIVLHSVSVVALTSL